MPQLGFMERFVPSVLDGTKPFTMRKVRRDGRCPKVGDTLHMFVNVRTPEALKFATARCVMRTTLWFDARGIAKLQHDGLDLSAPPIFGRVGDALLAAGDLSAAAQERGLHQLAAFDGFASWTDLWAFHSTTGKLDANGHALRRLIGFGDVQPTEAWLAARH